MGFNNIQQRASAEEYEKYKQRFLQKKRAIASKYLYKLDDLPRQPKELSYFKDILKKVFINNEAVRYSDDERFVGTFCTAMPPEIISAAGARPVRLCNSGIAEASIGEYMALKDVCPLVKSTLGSILGEYNEIDNICDLYIVPITCDCKKKLAAELSEYKPTLPLYIPLNRDDDCGKEMLIKEFKMTARKITEITGVRVARETLAHQIVRYAEVYREIERFKRLKNDSGLLMRGTLAMMVMNSMVYDDILQWGMHLKKLNDELTEKKNKKDFLTKRKMPRILLTGSPITFPNYKIPLIIEEQGGIITVDETCSGDRALSGFTAVCEDSLDGYYRALANRAVKPCTCPVFPDNRTRIIQLDRMVEEGHIDGIVYHVFRNCLVYDYEYATIEKHFSSKGIPVIRLESDCNDEDAEQLNIRIEAFLEMIKYKNKKKGCE